MERLYRFTNVHELREEVFRRPLEQYIAVRIDDKELFLDDNSIRRMEEVAEESDATITYAWYREKTDNGEILPHPLIDYQPGSVRDDFDFGSIVLLNQADVLTASEDFTEEDWNTLDGGWYALRLRLTISNMLAMVPEYLYTVRKTDYRLSGQKQHDYVDPRRRDYQRHMEEVLADHLYEINGLVKEQREHPDFEGAGDFPMEASVIIPVKNRVKTIGDAVKSALSQLTTFPYNVIVVDNASTDGTRDILHSITDPRLKLIELDGSECLGIGGCWNRAILSPDCGRFAVQLDSDDLYLDGSTLQQVVDKFYEENCAMVVGSYMMTDFDFNILPPGIIDHKEWNDDNGPNNALRVNGFGAPRAFFTPVVREILFPNVSYGEDYAVALRISRDYAVGRIYTPIYYCRRWSGNSDAALSQEKVNEHNYYKDFIRSIELMARCRENMNNENIGDEGGLPCD